MFYGLFFKLFEKRSVEDKLRIYNGYRHNSIFQWQEQLGLSWKITRKILRELKIITSADIRQMLRKIVNQNKNLFDSQDCYICKFGKAGKSGEVMLYEFSHSCKEIQNKVIELWQIPSLPENSKIVFLDDLVGTGRQSVGYIISTLNYFLNPSHQAYLLSLCCTPQGQNRVHINTNFRIISCLIMSEPEYQHYSNQSKVFNEKERSLIRKINEQLDTGSSAKFDKGLLIAFYYSVPNNTMLIIWKDNWEYLDKRRETRNWFALLPREY